MAAPAALAPAKGTSTATTAAVLATLNPAQRRAVSSEAATVAILAGPGSGKTHTLTSRVVWLVDGVGYRPQDVVVATFTVKAAREMKERIARALALNHHNNNNNNNNNSNDNGDGTSDGNAGSGGSDRARRLVLGTFHSIARRYLAAYGQKIGVAAKFGIADDADSRAIVSRICKRLNLGCDPAAARAWISKKKAKGTEEGDESGASAGGAKRRRLLFDKISQQPPPPGALQDLEACYAAYQEHLARSNLLDYDDLLVRCVELLRRFPACVSNVQAVLIDEYQDTNGVQYELMRLLAQQRRRITVVGDPDQSIYGWRSAEIRNLWRLLRDYPGTEEVALEENYRSSQLILSLALRVIQQDAKRYQKALKPVHSQGTRPVLRKLKSAAAEAEWIVSEIRRARLMSGAMVTLDDVAVLLRSASLSRHIEAALGRAGIAYRMVGGFKFYDRAEIRTLLDYLRVVHQPDNNDALARVLNVPRRGIGDGTIKALVEEAERSSLSLWTLLTKHCRGDRMAKTKITKQAELRLSGELLRLVTNLRKKMTESATITTSADTANDNDNNKSFGLVPLIEHLLASLKFQKFLQDSHPEDHEQRWANVQEFITLAADFVRDLSQPGGDSNDEDSLPEIEGVEQTREAEVLPKFLANVSLASDAQTKNNDDDPENEKNTPVVTISTIHAAKGLEWPIVFVPAAYTGSIPHARAEDADEERRLLYVAMTRAQVLLYLSYPVYAGSSNHSNSGSGGGGGDRNELSPFVAPLRAYFAARGPPLDRPVLEQVARILRRELPPDATIFGALPSMFCPEDDLFPEDPEAEAEGNPSDDAKSGGGMGAGARAPKRRRLQGPPVVADNGGSGEGGGGGSEQQPAWWKERATTMDQASSFTVASLPGFVSAGAHQATLAATAVQNQAKEAHRKATNRRSADQKSILGFVRSGSAVSNHNNPNPNQSKQPPPPPPQSRPPGNLPPPLPRQQQQYQHHPSARAPAPAIAPELANHRLPNTRAPVRPRALSPQRQRQQREEEGNTGVGGKPYAYACFSSSPPHPTSNSGVAETKENSVNVNVNMSAERAASSLHATTCGAMPKGFGSSGIIRRPTGLAREGLAPMERLRKPFKPLTMNRSS